MDLFNSDGMFPSASATAKFLAEHGDVFSSKKQLQHKIREVRQAIMSQSKAGNVTPGGLLNGLGNTNGNNSGGAGCGGSASNLLGQVKSTTSN